MTKEEWAALLDKRQYRNELTREEAKQAASDGIVIVHGGSDDIMYLAGAASDERYDDAWLTRDGLLTNKCEDDDCPYFAKLQEKAQIVEMKWDDGSGYSWTYKTNIPHATFDILEDEELYCRGIVFSLSDIPAS